MNSAINTGLDFIQTIGRSPITGWVGIVIFFILGYKLAKNKFLAKMISDTGRHKIPVGTFEVLELYTTGSSKGFLFELMNRQEKIICLKIHVSYITRGNKNVKTLTISKQDYSVTSNLTISCEELAKVKPDLAEKLAQSTSGRLQI